MSWLPFFDSAARIAIAILINGLWQGALIAFVAWLALRVFGKANASTRYAVWAIALCAVIVVPVATSLSRVTVETPATGTAHRTISTPSGPAHYVAQPKTHGVHLAAPPVKTRETHTSAQPKASSLTASTNVSTNATPAAHSLNVKVPTLVAAVVFALWLVASLVVLVRLGIALMALERLKRDALPLAVDYRDAMPRWDAALKGHRDVRLCVSDDIEVPVAIGLFDAMILLPSHLVHSLDPAEVDQISLHELAHLLRSDDWTNSLQRIASALLFFNPAVWFIARQLDIEREVACDDFVLQLTGQVRPYAFCLTKMAEMTAWPHRAVPAPGVFVTRKNISIRIERLLRTGRAIGSSIAPGIAASVSVALLAIFFLLRTMTPSIAFTEPQAPQPADAWETTAHAAVPPARSHPAPSVKASPVEAPKAKPGAPNAPIANAKTEETKTVVRKVVEEHVKMATDTASQALVSANAAIKAVPSVDLAVPPPAVSAHVSQLVHDSLKQSLRVAQIAQQHSSAGECVGCDYGNANLQNKDFSNRNLEGSNFARANLQGSHFDHASLTGVNFKDADLRNASFAGANLEGCNMKGAQLAGARFDGAQLTGCEIDVSRLSPDQARVVLSACEGCSFANVNLRGMDLRHVHLEGANLEGADLRGADLTGAMFTGVNFRHALLSGAHVNDTEFTGCDFNGADLRGVDLSKASITGSAMSGAIMRD